MKTTIQLLLTFLFNASWQIVLIAVAATLCDLLLRGTPARGRHAVWVISLFLAILVPALGLSPQFSHSSTVSNRLRPKFESTPVVITTIRSMEGEEIEPVDQKAPDAAAKSEPVRMAEKSWPQIRLGRNLAAAFVALYLLFVLYAATRLVRAWRRTRKLVRTAVPFEVPESIQYIVSACERAINARAQIMCSHAVAVPITVGTRRPLIILPSSILGETDEEILTSAIGHELVHVARRDYLTNLIYEFFFLPLSFHPAAMLMRRRIRQTRELCCDEWVASRLLKPEVYARSLVRLIGAVPISRRLAADTTIGIAESENLEVRIMSLLKMRRLTNRRNAFLLISALVLLVLPCLAASSFALSFEIKGQEPRANAPSRQQLERRDQERLRVELERQVQELKEKEKQVPAEVREEIDARILEVQRALEEHEKLLQQVEKQKQALSPDVEARLDEVRRNLEKHARVLEQYAKQNLDLEKAREAQKKLKELLDKYPENSSAARELQKLIEAQDELRLTGRMQGQLQLEPSQQSTRHAKVIYRVEPIYPDDAREKKITGSVLLTLTVDHDGLPQNIQVKKSLYPSMDQAAIEAARKMRFEPAMKDGQVVSDFLMVEFYFSMESKRVTGMGVGEGIGKSEGTSGAIFDVRRRKDEQGAQEDRARRQAELVQAANISMDRAIQIATSKYPGKVLACSLGRDKDGPVFYHLVIINTDGDKRTVKYVWISAVDGTIIKTEDEVRSASPISGGTLNSKALSLPNPAYPEIAREAKASGPVAVQITVDEQGNVIYAHAVSGHPLLQGAAVAAARQAKFTPTYLNGEAVKITGQVMYVFTAQ